MLYLYIGLAIMGAQEIAKMCLCLYLIRNNPFIVSLFFIFTGKDRTVFHWDLLL